jgi:hypothetical protein
VASALVTGGLAIAAVAGTLTSTTNLNHLVRTPAAYGWNWDFRAGIGFFPVPLDEALPKPRANADVEAVAGANYGEVTIGGRSVAAVGITAISGSLFPTLLEGRAPRDDHEIVLGSRTLRRARLAVGDTVTVPFGGADRTMRVVGRAIFPSWAPAASNPPTSAREPPSRPDYSPTPPSRPSRPPRSCSSSSAAAPTLPPTNRAQRSRTLVT